MLCCGQQASEKDTSTLTQAEQDSVLLSEYIQKQEDLDEKGLLEAYKSSFIKEDSSQALKEKDSIKRPENKNKKIVYKVSAKGENLIKNFEKCELSCYRINGESFNTIGWGHQIKSSDPKWLRRMTVGERINQKTADELFRKDMEEVNSHINYMLNTLPHDFTYTQGFIDGLGSLVYNCGLSNIMNSTFWQRLKSCRSHRGSINEDDLEYTLAAVKTTYVIMNGHKIRRLEEYKIMAQG